MKVVEKGVSIILCTYNGKNRLKSTFQHIFKQKTKVPIEVVFVDNASTDETKSMADNWWKENAVEHITYVSVIQSIPGKSYAQDLGYTKAKYEYLIICDDDNWLCDTYVQTAYDIMSSNSQIGALGGWCDAVFESNKPLWFDKYARFFAVSKQGTDSGDITQKKGCLYGAGMVIRKSHWIKLKKIGFEHLLSCRKGKSLSSGGDTEYSYALRLLGYKIWYDERLYFKHYMINSRLNFNYLSRLRKAMTFSNFILWPYLDLLNNKPNTYNYFISRVLLGFPKRTLIKLKHAISGNYESKEQAKFYFRTFYYSLFYYKNYRANRNLIEQWLKNKM
ncbi:glycosyltransferase [Aestuariibaculum sediminum]|uniref:Glycosyltransferase family 2 protein n=1 Tax=Aestuariibaculum sediminum TaxID=2770637 RepID=A0A8J6Q897_9FLAO|nr:glycosyltransferase [Aestuariibaculum sediminum]MBD0833088.1 glycosyltransferase family 2 protein [Aestuariibaculum sediminum]